MLLTIHTQVYMKVLPWEFKSLFTHMLSVVKGFDVRDLARQTAISLGKADPKEDISYKPQASAVS